MTSEERKSRERELKREMLIDVSERLVFERGFENVNINDIAGESGYTRRSIYLYFRDKDEILFHIVKRGQLLLLEFLKRAEQEHLDGGNTVQLFCDAIFNFAEEYPKYFELIMLYELRMHDYSIMYSGDDDIRSVCQNLSVDYGVLVTKAITRDLESGTLRSDLSARQLMLIFWGQVFGFMQIILQRNRDFSEIYGIERQGLIAEFKKLLQKIY